jgi:WYL_2, Sm-like SH3 beta-barrel fold
MRLPIRIIDNPFDVRSLVGSDESLNQMPETEQMKAIDFTDGIARTGLSMLLHCMPLIISFKKVDGSVRKIFGTTHPDWVVPYVRKTPKLEEAPFAEDKRSEVCAIFDLEKREWRSFRWNSVIGFSTY